MNTATSALRDSFIAVRPRAARLTQSDVRDLRGRMSILVRAMKKQGTLSDRVSDIVRQVAAGAGVTVTGNAVLEGVIQSCVAEYYPPPDALELDPGSEITASR